MSTGPNFFSISSALASHLSRLHHVVDHGGHARIIGGEFLQRVGELFVVDVAEHHLRALLMQCLRDAQADAAGTARDVGDLVPDALDGRRLRIALVRNTRPGSCAASAACALPTPAAPSVRRHRRWRRRRPVAGGGPGSCSSMCFCLRFYLGADYLFQLECMPKGWSTETASMLWMRPPMIL